MLLNREPEQEKRETNVTSDHMTSEYKVLRRNPPDVRLTCGKKNLVTQLKALKSRYAGSCQVSTPFHATVSCLQVVRRGQISPFYL